MRIDVRQTVPGINVRHDEVFQQGGFSHARLADHVHMSPAIVRLDAELPVLSAKIRLRERNDFVFVIMIVGRGGKRHTALFLSRQ